MSARRDEIISPSVLLAAIKRVLVNKESQRKVAKDFNIPRTNLQRYLDHVKHTILDVAAASDDDFLDALQTSTTMGPHSVRFNNFFRFFSLKSICRIFLDFFTKPRKSIDGLHYEMQ